MAFYARDEAWAAIALNLGTTPKSIMVDENGPFHSKPCRGFLSAIAIFRQQPA